MREILAAVSALIDALFEVDLAASDLME